MIPISLSELTRLLKLPEPQRDVTISTIVTDSRRVDHGSLFAALPGSQVDGHDFAGKAVEMGATALLVSRPLELDVPQLLVTDVLAALGEIARLLRTSQKPLVVGITGSNGKTTVKEMLASILKQSVQQQDKVLVTQGNYNNELGVPLTLFRMTKDDEFAVLEMGASKAGDIAYLAGIAQPDIGLITNIGPAHLEGFGSIEGVAAAKGEMFAALPENGCAIMNGDQPWLELWRSINRAGNVLTFGESPENDVYVEHTAGQPRMRTPLGDFDLELALPGKHNLVNAASATAAGLALGVSLEDIRLGLKAVKPVPGRLNLIRAKAG